MPIPNYQQLMLPLLKVLSDKKEQKTKDTIEVLSSQFNLSDEERSALLEGGQPIFNNRVGWARTYLKKAGLIDNPKRGVLLITSRGSEVLGQNPKTIDVKFLLQFPEFIEFVSPSNTENQNKTSILI